MILNIMKCLYDKTRLRIVCLLFYKNGPLCVGMVEESLQLSQPNASRHLKRLSEDGLVIATKKTQFVYYELNHEMLREYHFLNSLLQKNIEEMDECHDDINRLLTLKHEQCSEKINIPND
ncbi:MAG: ArsR/SmtB family transcription factor [Turicibacter sp.]